MKRYFLTLFLFVTALRAELFFTPAMIASHLKGYSEQEIELLNKDLEVVRGVCCDDTHETAARFYLATAGGPGARKTTILERFVANHPEYQGGIYLDPDPRALKFMVHTYYAKSLTPLVIANTSSYDQVIRDAYQKWRGGSNYIALTLLEEAFAEDQSVIYGTTSTGSHMSAFFKKLQERGYQIVLLLCSCPDAVRFQAVDYRNKTIRFYQSSPEEAVSKGILFPQRMETYFAFADQLYFYWSDDVFGTETLAGVWQNGTLEIHDAEAMQCFVDKYEEDRETLAKTGVSIPSFSSFPQ